MLLVRHEDIVLLLSCCRSHVGQHTSVDATIDTDTAGRCGVRQLSALPAPRFFRTTDKSHLISANKGPSPSITDSISLSPTGLYSLRQGIVINAPASHRRLHGLGEHSSAADIHLGSRPIGLCLLYWQRML